MLDSDVFCFPIKININLDLSEELTFYLSKLNGNVDDIVGTEIVFSASSLHKPHLTLLVGVCNSQKDLDEIHCCIKSFADNFPFVSLRFESPSKNMLISGYGILMATRTDDILAARKNLSEKLIDFMDFFPDKREYRPHVTYAYILNHSDLLGTAIETCGAPPASASKSISISLIGVRGSCLGTVTSFYLNGLL